MNKVYEMAITADTYQPINQLKPIGDDIWIVDGPVILFKGLPFPTRMTIVRLKDGGLFVHSPTQLTGALKTSIDELGSVTHLISPNRIHYWWIGAWGKRYPQAIKWASPKVRPSAVKQGWQFDRDLGDEAPPEWQDDIAQVIARGGRFMEEVVFFHKASRTLILTDLIENFEASRMHPKAMVWLLKLAGNLDPDGKLPIDLRMTYWGRYGQLRAAVQQMIDWDPEKIILAHGRWYEENGAGELRRAFRFLKGLK